MDGVDDQGRQRRAFDFLGDDQQRLAGLGDTFQHRQQGIQSSRRASSIQRAATIGRERVSARSTSPCPRHSFRGAHVRRLTDSYTLAGITLEIDGGDTIFENGFE